MTVKTLAKVKPAFPFEAYSHIVSPIDAADVAASCSPCQTFQA
jgi:hypothetical protein